MTFSKAQSALLPLDCINGGGSIGSYHGNMKEAGTRHSLCHTPGVSQSTHIEAVHCAESRMDCVFGLKICT